MVGGFDRFRSNVHLLTSRVSTAFATEKHLANDRFAFPHELKKLLSPTLDGVNLLLGEAAYNHVLQVSRTKAHRELGNVLVVAPTRGGKGLLAESQLLTWQGSVIVNDIKGELFTNTAGYRATLGKVYVIDPSAIGHQYNPLAGKASEDELYTSAEYLLFEPHDGEGRVFTQRATKMLTQMLLAGIAEGEPLFLVLREMVNAGLEATAQRLYRISPQLATKFLEVQYEHVNWENKFLVSAWETLSARLYPLLTENIVRCLSGSNFTPREIIHSKKPVTVYLRWPEYKLHALSPLIKLIWATMIDEMVYTYDTAPDKKTCYPVLLLIDEAGRSAIPHLYDFASTVVGRHISLWLAILLCPLIVYTDLNSLFCKGSKRFGCRAASARWAFGTRR